MMVSLRGLLFDLYCDHLYNVPANNWETVIIYDESLSSSSMMLKTSTAELSPQQQQKSKAELSTFDRMVQSAMSAMKRRERYENMDPSKKKKINDKRCAVDKLRRSKFSTQKRDSLRQRKTYCQRMLRKRNQLVILSS